MLTECLVGVLEKNILRPKLISAFRVLAETTNLVDWQVAQLAVDKVTTVADEWILRWVFESSNFLC